MNISDHHAIRDDRMSEHFVEGEGKDHRVINALYRAAIIRAINELKDMQLRSKVNDIRGHVQDSLRQDHNWNDTIFLKTLKGLVSDGDIEQCAVGNFSLSSEFKERRTKSMERFLERRSPVQYAPPENLPHLATEQIQGKVSPAKKPVHAKQKIIPKKIYDSLHVPIKHPMDTL